ncbi:MAG: protein-L-isoaspartate(D-aspartate) O-methyltransferase [Alphaproteobacteria bacterium]|nr:protein-L-isoaspartate(D-aspartate) O-methyltransferase [Alphaproteobacteria bacterium]
MDIAIEGQNNNKRIRLIMHLRNMGIRETKVMSALERVPRDFFVPEAMKDQAWDDIALPIGHGQTISQPFVVSIMTQALELSDRDKVLEIGTGCGYQAAVLCKLARRVYTIERHKSLLEAAERRFEELRIRNITALVGDGMLGWPTIGGIDQAPFDKIIVTAAAREKPPKALLDQLKIGGIMIIPVGENGEQILRCYKKESDDTFAIKDIIPVRFVPLLPDIASYNEGNDEAA